jgi:hypothetical protein
VIFKRRDVSVNGDFDKRLLRLSDTDLRTAADTALMTASNGIYKGEVPLEEVLRNIEHAGEIVRALLYRAGL